MAGFPLHLLLVLPLLVIVPLAYILRLARRRTGHRRLPPGPWALPVIGHLHHLLDALPHHRLRDLSRRHGPLMLLRFGDLPVVVASSVDAAREIMKTHDLAFSTRPIGPATRLALVEGSEGLSSAPYGDGWRQLRKICTLELLSARRVQSFRAVREQEVARLLRAVVSSAPPGEPAVNLSSRTSSYVADSAARAMIGSRFKDRAAFFRLLEQGLKLFSSPSLPDLYPSSRLAMFISRTPSLMKKHRVEMMAFMETIIQEHQVPRGDDVDDDEEDLVDVLLRIHRDSELQFPIAMDSIKAVVADLLIAGSETSATTLQWAMSELVMNPRVMQKVQDEVRRVVNGQERVTEGSLSNLHYLHLVIKETLRLHPPVPLLLPRKCREPCQILGFDVPVGATVFVNAWAIGRDAMHWDAPEEFVPERFEHINIDFKGTDFEYIPFGAGRRMCPGMTFGLANVELALASLLYHFDWEMPNGVDLDMAEVMGVTARRRDDLLLVPMVKVPV
ncbi:Premnaspirodiene oxygenase [Dichanthelium oligosanthes]|uniref:Premnaspirodiene oxygenase n=1 Tax=Dichanthelium oligosanthes TaxID=888268 RepID=A0A1E5V129_9POAL|nr:Premnaspirodiene oxygenase [Dichanthelium oligosanthes]